MMQHNFSVINKKVSCRLYNLTNFKFRCHIKVAKPDFSFQLLQLIIKLNFKLKKKRLNMSYCITKYDAFHASAPINLMDCLTKSFVGQLDKSRSSLQRTMSSQIPPVHGIPQRQHLPIHLHHPNYVLFSPNIIFFFSG